jgi:hypothetical protein
MSEISLNTISGFDHTLSYYRKNQGRDWKEWIEFDQIFNKPSKQGIVGLFQLGEGKEGKDEKEEKEEMKVVFKFSQYINWLSFHEYTVMRGLNELSEYCPHFCKMIGIISCEVDPAYRKSSNPFEIKSKYPIEKEVLLLEYISDSAKMYNYIRSNLVNDDVIHSSIKQVLLAISIAQRKKRFTHYDLHSYNIMMKKCDPNLVFVYVLDDTTQFCVPTYGHYPVIIDFGFSYISDMDDGPLWSTLAHTDVGFMSDRFDPLSDPKLFLVTLAEELKEKRRRSPKTKTFRNIVKNIFGNLNIDWESGWDEGEEQGASDCVLDLVENYNTTSKLFKNYDHYCIDLIQSLIILPLERQNYKNIGSSYQMFLNEFSKIENEIGSDFYNLYILKGIVNAARAIRADYLNTTTRRKALQHFQRAVFKKIDCIARFCRLKTIHFEKMLCGILAFSKNVEGVLYDFMVSRESRKQREYSKMELKSVDEIYAAIETNIPNDYVFNVDSKIVVLDSIDEGSYVMELTNDDIEEVNEMHSLGQGTFLYHKFLSQKQ